MFKRLKLWYARRQLMLAIREEENARNYARHVRYNVIPGLEVELQKAEISVLCDSYFKE